MKIFRSVLLLACLFCAEFSHALDKNEIIERFQLVPEPQCVKPKLREPPRMNTPFFMERRYLSIDGGHECQILDVWVAPLTPFANENRRYMESALYRRRGKSWVKEYGLDYVPKFRVLDKKTGKIYFYIHLDETPFYKDEIVYFNGVWKEDKNEKSYFGNIKNLGDCHDVDKDACLEDAWLVRKAVEYFKQQ